MFKKREKASNLLKRTAEERYLEEEHSEPQKED